MAVLSNVILIDLGSVCLVNRDTRTVVAFLVQDPQVPFRAKRLAMFSQKCVVI